MDKLFFKIYVKILLLCALVAVLSYSAFMCANHYRKLEYTRDITGGIFKLITDGYSRQSDKTSGELWLEAVSRLIGADIKHVTLSGTDYNLKVSQDKLEVIYPLANNNGGLYVSLPGLTERQLRIAAILILNELGRHPPENQEVELNRLRGNFSFPLSIIQPNASGLDNARIRNILSGEVLVMVDKLTSATAINVYAPYGNTGTILRLGSIAIFEAYPASVIIPVFILAIFSTGFGMLLIFRPIEKRLHGINLAIRCFRDNKGKDPVKPEDSNSDIITGIGTALYEMSSSISDMITNQSNMLHIMAHEFNTPVARIKFRTAMIDRNQLDNASRDKLEGIERDTDELALLIEQAVSFLKAEGGEAQSGNINLMPVIKEILTDCQMLRCDIKTSISGSQEANLNTNPILAKLTLTNLIGNACKYALSYVFIEISDTDEALNITIRNDNIVKPDNADDLAQAFKRSSGHLSKGIPGHGLGLGIAVHAARKIGGAVQFHFDNNSDTIATFTIYKKSAMVL